MAATLTDELTRVSVADIEKWDEADGTVYVYGRCTTPEVDTDDQVVDSGWSGPALKEYLATAPTVRVQHNPQRDPAGSAVRVDVNRDGDGAHWLKAAVDEPVAQRLVKKGHLRAFSVGIARPVIERDVSGKARGGVIKGGKIVEVSIVDSPANRSCFLEIAKSAADGSTEFTGKLIADDDVLQKALGADLTKGGSADTWTETSADMSRFGFPEDLSVTFTPNDMARLMQSKIVEKHYQGLAAQAADTGKRDIGAADRRRIAGEGNAVTGSDGHISYPIENESDLHNAATLARSGHGDVAAARRLIARRARELGVANPLDESDDAKKSEGEVTVNLNVTGSGLDKAELTRAAQAGILRKAKQGRTTAIPMPEEAAPAAAKEADPDLTKSCSACSGGSCDGDGCSCGGCTGSKCACGSTQKAEEPARPVKKAKKKPKGGKKLPPWLNKPDSDGSDDDKGSSGDDGACKGAHAWIHVGGASPVPDIRCEKCKTTPAEAAGLSGTHDMTCAPVPELLESPPMASTKGGPTPQSASGAGEAPPMNPVARHREPDGALADPFEKDAGLSDGDAETPTRLEAGMMKASPEVAAMLRFKRAGIDAELGRLHDLTCPAYHPEDVAKCHPFSDLRHTDEGYFQRKAVEAACGPSMELAKSLNLAWQAARVLRETDPAVLNDYRMEAHKAFRDANPGPSSAPSPGQIAPGKYNRPLITDGHEASSPAHDGPNSSPQVATTAPDAHSFDRPPLSAGHQSPSPSFMKASFEYPSETGRPMQLNYAVMEKERARQALMQMHEHLSRQFPEACPIDLDRPPVQPESRGVPPTAGIGKSEAPAAAPAPVAASFKAEPEQDGRFADADIYKGFKKQRKKLGKKVLSGSMTVDEARAKLGRQFAQKGTEPSQDVAALALEQVQKGIISIDEARARLNLPPWETPETGAVPAHVPSGPKPLAPVAAKAAAPSQPETVTLTASNFGTDPEIIKAAVAEATSELKDLLVKQQETFTTKLAEQQRVIDAIADQPDPSTAAFSGLAFNPVQKRSRPAGVIDQAEIAERTQQMMIRHLQEKYNASSDPAEREAYYGTLAKMRGMST